MSDLNHLPPTPLTALRSFSLIDRLMSQILKGCTPLPFMRTDPTCRTCWCSSWSKLRCSSLLASVTLPGFISSELAAAEAPGCQSCTRFSKDPQLQEPEVLASRRTLQPVLTRFQHRRRSSLHPRTPRECGHVCSWIMLMCEKNHGFTTSPNHDPAGQMSLIGPGGSRRTWDAAVPCSHSKPNPNQNSSVCPGSASAALLFGGSTNKKQPEPERPAGFSRTLRFWTVLNVSGCF